MIGCVRMNLRFIRFFFVREGREIFVLGRLMFLLEERVLLKRVLSLIVFFLLVLRILNMSLLLFMSMCLFILIFWVKFL